MASIGARAAKIPSRAASKSSNLVLGSKTNESPFQTSHEASMMSNKSAEVVNSDTWVDLHCAVFTAQTYQLTYDAGVEMEAIPNQCYHQ